MPLDAVPSNDVMEVLAFKVSDTSPVLALSWQDLQFKQPIHFLGIIRDGEWLLPDKKPVFNAKDTLMVLAKLKHVQKISEVLANDAEKSVLSNSNFFGDFVLNGNISLSDLDAFYTINLEGLDSKQTLAGYIGQRFHRRVVIGDRVQLDQLLLTVRQVNDAGEASQVGIKPVED